MLPQEQQPTRRHARSRGVRLLLLRDQHTRAKCVIGALVDITNKYNNDKAHIACECGNLTIDHAPDMELTRRGVGCGGTVAFPFRNGEGISLVFKLRSFGVECAFRSDEMVVRQRKPTAAYEIEEWR